MRVPRTRSGRRVLSGFQSGRPASWVTSAAPLCRAVGRTIVDNVTDNGGEEVLALGRSLIGHGHAGRTQKPLVLDYGPYCYGRFWA
jgi:hypothetical protein